MSDPSRIFLVGPMGAGKTTTGRRLAAALGLDFADSDAEIERRTGVDIPFIFEKEGEAGFRRREHAVLAELARRQRIVVATGGGAVLLPENRALMRAAGHVVYLRASIAQQLARTRRTAHRPLLQQGDREQTLRRLFAERDPLYREVADIIVETEGLTSRQVLARLRAALTQGIGT